VSDGAIIIGQRVAVVVPYLRGHVSAAWHGDWRICDVGVSMIDDGLTEDERDDLLHEVQHLSHMLAERDKEITELRKMLEKAVMRGCNHCMEVIGPIRDKLYPGMEDFKG
jgi:hypothetical protein